METPDAYYTAKCGELDDMLKKHFMHKDSKRKSLEACLREETQQRRHLQKTVEALTAELEKERQYSKSLLRQVSASETSFRATVAEEEQRLRMTDLQLASRVHALDLHEKELSEYAASLEEREAALEAGKKELSRRQEKLKSEISMTHEQMQEDIAEAEKARLRGQKFLQDARGVLQEASSRQVSTHAFYSHFVELTRFECEELEERMKLIQEETSVRFLLLRSSTRCVLDSALHACKRNDESANDLALQKGVLTLREKEINTHLERELASLREEHSKLLSKKEAFVLDCQSILRSLNLIATDMTSQPSSYPDIDALRKIEETLQVLLEESDR